MDLTALAADLIVAAQGFDFRIQAPPGLQIKANTMFSWLFWFGLGTGIYGLTMAGIMMTAGRRNRSSMAADGAAGIPWVAGGLILIGFSVSLATAILV